MTKIYAAMGDGLLVGSRRNGSWETERRLVGSSPQGVAADPSRPEVVYCGTFDRGLWRSVDAGDSWEHVGEGLVRDLVTAVAISAGSMTGSRNRSWGKKINPAMTVAPAINQSGASVPLRGRVRRHRSAPAMAPERCSRYDAYDAA